MEKKDCVACGKCVEACPAGAVKLGQKLCTRDGAIEYPKQELPDTTKWGRQKWSPNYCVLVVAFVQRSVNSMCFTF